MLLERDRIGIALGHALHHLGGFQFEFVAPRSTFIGAHLPGDDQGRLLRQPLERVPHSGATLLLTTTPCTRPEPSRMMGKSNLPLSRRL